MAKNRHVRSWINANGMRNSNGRIIRGGNSFLKRRTNVTSKRVRMEKGNKDAWLAKKSFRPYRSNLDPLPRPHNLKASLMDDNSSLFRTRR